MSRNVVPDKFEKKTDTFSICATNREIDLNIFCYNVVIQVFIIDEAEIHGEEGEYVDIGEWRLDVVQGALVFINGDISIRLEMSYEDIELFFNVVLCCG